MSVEGRRDSLMTALSDSAVPSQQVLASVRHSQMMSEDRILDRATRSLVNANGLPVPEFDPAFTERLKTGEEMLNDVVGEGTGHTAGARDRFVRLAPARGATRLIVTFAGNTKSFACPDALALYPSCHLLALRDPFRCFAMTGIPYLGTDYESTVAAIRGIASTLAVQEIFLLGASAGGYAALRYALDIDAQGVLGLSAPTTLDINNDPEGSTAKYPQLALLYRHAREMAQDLVPLYRDRRPRPRVLLVYAPSQERDAWLASRMDNLDGVEVVQAPQEAGHRTLMFLSKKGQMEQYLDRLFALTPLR